MSVSSPNTRMATRMSKARPPHRRLAFLLSTAVITASAALCSTGAAAQDRFGGLEREMTPEERAAAGIDTLDPAQVEYLNQWLRDRFNQVEAEAASEAVAASVSAVSSDAAREADIQAEVERRVAVEVEAARQEIRADDEAEQNNEPFEASITGGFSGWGGKTVFTLDNGQVWRQRHGSAYRHTTGDTRVRFEQNFFGLWEMTVLSSGRTVGVRRID